MTYTPQTSDEIRQQILDDQEYLMREAGVSDPPVGVGSDAYVRADAVAGAMLIAYANLDVARSQSVYWSATGTRLQEHREALGVPAQTAIAARGRLKVSISGDPVNLTTADQFTLANGFVGHVAASVVGVVDGQEVAVEMLTLGAGGNAVGGTVVNWTSPPLGMGATATVSAIVPLTGGADVATDSQVQDAIRERVQGRPGSGNEAQLRELAKNAGVVVQECYVYPALGGPGTAKVVPVKAIDPSVADWSRAHDSDALDRIRSAVQAGTRRLPGGTPIGFEVVVQPPIDSPTNVALLATLQPAASAGGDGTGWANSTPWPPAHSTNVRVTISSIASETQITVDVDTATAPLDKSTQIGWWSPHDQAFHVFRVEAHSGGSGAWVLTLDRSMLDSLGNPPTAGDYISPASVGLMRYGDSFRAAMGKLAPGENKAGDERAQRIPGALEGATPSLGDSLLFEVKVANPEVISLGYGYRNQTTPVVPGDVETAPYVLTLNHLGIYPA